MFPCDLICFFFTVDLDKCQRTRLAHEQECSPGLSTSAVEQKVNDSSLKKL